MKDGDFVLIDFVGRIKLTNEIFDLTVEEEAKKENIYNKDQKYEPAFVIIGARMIVPGVDKQLLGMNVGDEKTFDVPVKEAFGPRDPRLIKILNINQFYKNKINPVPNTFVQIEGHTAKVQSVSGGRVRTDFNSPLAGKDLIYKVKIVSQITDPKEKIERILGQYRMGFRSVEVKEKTATISSDKKMPEMLEKMITDIVKKWVKEVEKVTYIAPKEEKTRK
ncbi:MAG: peptidylprolyl isomerase [Candidatus Aenigmarchaeota archaeon]|nr:peptidylprolyl isomerase [Candidatus Aenigmarchaeota archaeon]